MFLQHHFLLNHYMLLHAFSQYSQYLYYKYIDIYFMHQPPKINKIKIGPSQFLIGPKIRQGGFSKVYKVTKIILETDNNLILGDSYALKMIPLKQNPQETQMMAKQAIFLKAHSLDRHKNIIKVYDTVLDKQRGCLLVLTEEAIVFTLRDLLQNRKLTFYEIIYIFRQICQGIQHLHQLKLIHRDIKKSNICFGKKQNFFSPYQKNQLSVKIIDLGIADYQQLIDKKNSSGTTAYLSPQLLRQQKQSFESDVWALGVLLYQMVTNGVNPFQGKTNQETYKLILSGNYKPIQKQQNKMILELIQNIFNLNPQKRIKLHQIIKKLDEEKTKIHLSVQSLYYRPIQINMNDKTKTLKWQYDQEYWKKINKIRKIKLQHQKGQNIFVDTFFKTINQNHLCFLTIDCKLYYYFKEKEFIVVDFFQKQIPMKQQKKKYLEISWKGFIGFQGSLQPIQSQSLQKQKRFLINFYIAAHRQRIQSLNFFLKKQASTYLKQKKILQLLRWQKNIEFQLVHLQNDIIQLDFIDMSSLILNMNKRQMSYINLQINSQMTFNEFTDVNNRFLSGYYNSKASEKQLAEQLHKKYNRVKKIIQSQK